MNKTLAKYGHRIILLSVVLTIILLGVGWYGIYSSEKKIYTQAIQSNSYDFAWPGILPDSRFYKVKVLRNKIIEKIIINPVKKVEFDLLMADKTIYASKLLLEKGEVELAKDTALKGENYYSILVQDYNTALLKNKKIPTSLDQRITQAHLAHKKIFKEMENMVSEKDKEVFKITSKFSEINYQFIIGLRTSRFE